MFGRDLGFYVVSVLTAIVATGCGILFASIAWIQMGYEPKQRTPNLMYTFAAAIACNGAGIVVPWCINANVLGANVLGFEEMSLITWFLLIASFILVVITLRLLSKYEGSGRGALKVGSVIMIILYGIGCIGMLTV